MKSSSSSSSCRAASTDIPDPLPPLLPIIHRFWQVFRVTSRNRQRLICHKTQTTNQPNHTIPYGLSRIISIHCPSCLTGKLISLILYLLLKKKIDGQFLTKTLKTMGQFHGRKSTKRIQKYNRLILMTICLWA